MKTCAVLLTLAGVAAAQPAPMKPPVPKVCGPAYAPDMWLDASTTEATACWKGEDGESCVAVTPAGAMRGVATVPPVPLAEPTTIKDGRACAGATCVKLGKKLLAAIAAEKKKHDDDPQNYFGDFAPHATADLKLVAIGGKAWVIAGDKLLKLKPPVEYAKQKQEKPSNGWASVANGLMVGSWSNCAGPCTKGVVVDAKGANKGAWFDPGLGIALDDKRTLMIPQEADSVATVIENATGKTLGTLTLGEGVLDHMLAARVDDKTVAVMFSADGWKVEWIEVPASGNPTVRASKVIPLCP